MPRSAGGYRRGHEHGLDDSELSSQGVEEGGQAELRRPEGLTPGDMGVVALRAALGEPLQELDARARPSAMCVCVVGGEAGRLLGEVLVSTMEWVEGVLDGTQNREEQGEASWGGRRCPLWAVASAMDGWRREMVPPARGRDAGL